MLSVDDVTEDGLCEVFLQYHGDRRKARSKYVCFLITDILVHF